MPDIYDQHKAAFANVWAYVIARNGKKVATIAFKYPRDGAGRLYAYVHWLGVPMVRGFAQGYGYDKNSAAVANATKKLAFPDVNVDGHFEGIEDQTAFIDALNADDGPYWNNRLEAAGFTVWQAV